MAELVDVEWVEGEGERVAVDAEKVVGLMWMHIWLLLMSLAQTIEVDLVWSAERQFVEAEGARVWFGV